MVHSMTAFARNEQATAHGTLSWELRSVNHRYLEPHLRLPEAFRDLEGAVREALRQGLSRGKVECTLRFAEETAGKPLQVDSERARQLIAAAEQVAALIQQPAPLNPLEVLAWPGVLVADAADPQALNAAALTLFEQALTELKNGRAREGAELAKLLNERLDGIQDEVAALRVLIPEMLANQRQKIETRFAEMRAELDPQRLEQELVLLAQKSDVADPQALNAAALKLFDQALGELKAGRAREGAELAKLLNDRLDAILDEVAALRELVPQMLAGQRQKIEARFAEMQAELDPQRLEQELVLLAQKSDVAEELDRLSTHVSEVRRVLKAGGAAGRRLDFLMQELNREATTLGSKAFDPRSTQAEVNLKVLIEQMREKVQNIERKLLR